MQPGHFPFLSAYLAWIISLPHGCRVSWIEEERKWKEIKPKITIRNERKKSDKTLVRLNCTPYPPPQPTSIQTQEIWGSVDTRRGANHGAAAWYTQSLQLADLQTGADAVRAIAEEKTTQFWNFLMTVLALIISLGSLVLFFFSSSFPPLMHSLLILVRLLFHFRFSLSFFYLFPSLLHILLRSCHGAKYSDSG